MSTVNIDIKPNIINWALKQIDKEQLGEKMLHNISKWINGDKKPTFNQVQELSKKTHIPFGYFFLAEPPVEDIKLIEYRTVDSRELASPSRDLIDTIYEMENVQDWMRNYRKEEGFYELQIVGCLKNENDVHTIVEKIRTDIGLSENWFFSCKDKRYAFNYIRGLLEQAGIVVMVNGIVATNTHRPLNVKEFRAFEMLDKWAPLIFINNRDSNGAKVFSIFHEMAHIWLGEDDLYNDSFSYGQSVKSIEVICNAVAGELIVPTEIFLQKWNEDKNNDIEDKISDLSELFKCSRVVIVRKALDNQLINRAKYDSIALYFAEHSKDIENNRVAGGDFYNTVKNRLDGNFATALYNSVSSGNTTYTEAYRLTHTNKKTFDEVMSKFGGVL